MKRALLLESGRFRAYVNDGKAKIHPEFSEVTDADDAAALASLAIAIKAEIAVQSAAQPLDSAALQRMIMAQQQGSGYGGLLGGLFGGGAYNPFTGNRA